MTLEQFGKATKLELLQRNLRHGVLLKVLVFRKHNRFPFTAMEKLVIDTYIASNNK
jgi:L-ribulose-5-phosphate 3-epimerase UlaE